MFLVGKIVDYAMELQRIPVQQLNKTNQKGLKCVSFPKCNVYTPASLR